MSLIRSLHWIDRLMYAQASGISAFSNEISRLIDEAERQYGLANRGYTEYILVRVHKTTRKSI